MPVITMGIVLVAFLAASTSLCPLVTDNINLETHQLGHKLRAPIQLPLRISVLDGNVLSLCGHARAAPAELPRHGSTHELDRTSIETLSEGLSSAAAPEPSLQH